MQPIFASNNKENKRWILVFLSFSDYSPINKHSHYIVDLVKRITSQPWEGTFSGIFSLSWIKLKFQERFKLVMKLQRTFVNDKLKKKERKRKRIMALIIEVKRLTFYTKENNKKKSINVQQRTLLLFTFSFWLYMVFGEIKKVLD